MPESDARGVATYLGFDYGPRKIGVAVGQTISGSATPLTTLRGRGERPDWAGITELIQVWQPSALVVGLPFNMDDTEVEWSARVHRFARQLEGRYRLVVHLVDERLTSVEAERLLDRRQPFAWTAQQGGRQTAMRPAGKQQHAAGLDALAAALILETWLREQH